MLRSLYSAQDNLCWADAEETILQLVDFGYASTVNEQSNFAGSPHYAAPEVHLVNRDFEEDEERPAHLAAGADLWSAGVCLFAMLATQLPFGGDEDTEEEQAALRAKVCSGVWDVQPSGVSESAIDLLTRIGRSIRMSAVHSMMCVSMIGLEVWTTFRGRRCHQGVSERRHQIIHFIA